MHRTDAPGATVDNKFTDGDPVGGVQSTLVDASWLNDVQENIIAVLAAAGVPPTKGRAADLLDSVRKVALGRLLRRSVYRNNTGILQVSIDGSAFANASSTFTAQALTAKVRAILQGGGGSGAATLATGAGQVSAGSGGGGGGYCEKVLTSNFNGLSISVGAGGDGALGAGGGTTSFGPSLSASGGPPGGTGLAGTPSNNFFGGTPGGIGVGGDINGRGGAGSGAFLGSAVVSGYGGSSIFGAGSYIVSGASTTGTPGIPAESYGSGGSGAANGASVGVTRLGGSGASGLLILEEYA